MKTALAVAAGLLTFSMSASCGSGPAEPSGSTAYFFAQLDHADANADYFTLPRSLADTLPNRTYRSREGTYQRPITFTWSERFVIGRVTSVRSADQSRIRIRIQVQESFPATDASMLEVLVAGDSQDEKRYLASAASLDRIVIGVETYRDGDGEDQIVAAMASQLIGVVDDAGRITYPVLRSDNFATTSWDHGMTTLDGLREQAAQSPSTIAFGRG